MNKRFLFWGVLFLTIANLASLGSMGYHKWIKTSVNAQPTCAPTCMASESDCKKLNLTDCQRKDLIRMRADLDSSLAQTNQQIQSAEKKLMNLLKAPNPDTSDVFSTLSEIQNLQGCLQEQVINNILAEKSILDTKQCSLYCNIIHERMAPGKSSR